MVAKSALLPAYHHSHLTATISPEDALQRVSKFLRRTQSKPYLHPDSLLSSSGIAYSAHSGPSGGLAIHHLRRIEAGLRGENLIAETANELLQWEHGQDAAQNGEDALLAGDDSRLDALIDRQEQQLSGKNNGGLKRKRGALDIAEWAETSSQAGATMQELESFANTPLHVSDWQDQEEYQLEQSPLEGEVGDRDGAPVVQQNGVLPEPVEHDDEGNEIKKKNRKGREKYKNGTLTNADRQARKADKKARKVAIRQEKAREAKEGKG